MMQCGIASARKSRLGARGSRRQYRWERGQVSTCGAALLGWIAGELIVGEKVLQPYVAAITDKLGIDFHTFELWCATVGASFVIAVGLLVMRARSGAHRGGPD